MNENDMLKEFLSGNKFEQLAIQNSLKELKKQVKKGDTKKVEEIVDFLLEVQGKNDTAENLHTEKNIDDIVNNIYNNKKNVKNKRYIPKKIIASVVSVIALFTTNSIVKATTNQNILTLAVDISKSGFSIDLSETIELPTSEDDPYGIKGECRKYGYTPEVPFYLPEGFELKHVSDSYIESEEWTYNCFTFKKGKASICLTYNYYSDKISSITIPSDDFNLSEIEVNGTKAILSQEDGQYVVNYQKDKIIYVIFIQHVDYSECDKIIESIK